MTVSMTLPSVVSQPPLEEDEDALFENALSTSSRFVESLPSYQPQKVLKEEFHCPHCNEKIRNMDLLLIELFLSDKEMIDWALPCPHCGKTIRKADVVTN